MERMVTLLEIGAGPLPAVVPVQARRHAWFPLQHRAVFQAAPAIVTLTPRAIVEQGIAGVVLDLSWDAPTGADTYLVEWQRIGGTWERQEGVTATAVADLPAPRFGAYQARVYALNVQGVSSRPAYSNTAQVDSKTAPPPAPFGLVATGGVFSIRLDIAFPSGSEDTQRTEIWYAPGNDRATAVKLGDFAFPQSTHTMMGLGRGVRFYFWARLVDRSGNVGGWYPAAPNAGVMGESSDDPGLITDYLAGAIGKDQLTEDLRAPIEGISPDMAGTAQLYAGDNTRYAGVWSQLYAQQVGDMALARKVDTVAAAIDDTAAAVQQTSQAIVGLDGRISATYTVRAQITSAGQIYQAGMGLGVEQQADGTFQSQVYMLADRFAFLNLVNGAVTVPFVIDGGTTYIRSAMIQDGTITTAKIQDAAIVNAKIGSYIQSDNYTPGQAGWRIHKNGEIEINGVGNDYRVRILNSGFYLYDANGVLRVELGVLT